MIFGSARVKSISCEQELRRAGTVVPLEPQQAHGCFGLGVGILVQAFSGALTREPARLVEG